MNQIHPSRLFPDSPDCNRIAQGWMNQLPGCSLQKARTLLTRGGNLQVHLDETSTLGLPLWRAILEDVDGKHWSLCSVKTGLPRQLKSVQQVYQVARNLGLSGIAIPVER